jgi:hypothetical protein
MNLRAPSSVIVSAAEIIQAACGIIPAAIDKLTIKSLPSEVTQSWFNTGPERAKANYTNVKLETSLEAI